MSTRTAGTRARATGNRAAANRGAADRRPGARTARRTGRSRPRRTDSPRPFISRRGRIVLAAILALVSVLTALAYAGPLLAVDSVVVEGNSSVPTEQIVAAAAVATGTPLPRVDTSAAAQRIAGIAPIASVRVRRSYPSTVRVSVVERVPVAFFDGPDGTHLMDATGVDFAVAPPPPGVVRLVVATAAEQNLETRAALTVLTALPEPLRVQVGTVAAPSISAVTLTLLDGRTVIIGAARDVERKAAVALPLLTRPGGTFDVSSPDLPTTR